MDEYTKELITYESEKRMDALALKGVQSNIAEQLKGSMGKDMTDVLSGKKKVQLTFWTKIKYNFDKFLNWFN
jgi:hypothetical protein